MSLIVIILLLYAWSNRVRIMNWLNRTDWDQELENIRSAGSRRSNAETSWKSPFLKCRPRKRRAVLAEAVGVIIAAAAADDMITGYIHWSGEDIFYLIAGILLLIWGERRRRLVNLYYRYGSIAGSAETVEVEELAQQTGKSEDYVKKQLKRMMDQDILRGARMDRQQTTVILTERAYRLYREVSRQREEAQKQKAEEQAKKQAARAQAVREGNGEAAEILEQGEQFLKRLQDADSRISEPSMKQEIEQLGTLLRQIMDQLRSDPSGAGSLRKYMNLYLPTVGKLIDDYIELGARKSSANAASSRKEIEDVLKTVNGASRTLLDQLMENSYIDISSDVTVLKQMMERDGLLEQDR